ncbi:MAG TPA: hypothetical protein VN520_29745, partial [Streptomyces sp.]|nr:hypothetical protein [Streptomyces sp.]
GDGASEETAAAQAVLDACEPGSGVYLPAGRYRTGEPVRIGPCVTFKGSRGPGGNEHDAAGPSFGLKPLPGPVGEAVVLVLDQMRGGCTRRAVEPRIFDLTIDGSALPRGGAETDGIRAVGRTRHLRLRDTRIREVTGIGVSTVLKKDPSSEELSR